MRDSRDVTPEYEKEAERFYAEFLNILNKSGVPYLIGGTYAVRFYTGIRRPTKDIDVFCKASDYPKLLRALQDEGYAVEITDERWLAKAFRGEYYADIIFGSIPQLWPIDDRWIKNASEGELLGKTVKFTPPAELIISKMYRHGRMQYDGADVTHIILKQGAAINWKHLLNRAEPNWEVLFAHVIMFRFAYPSDRGIVPKWVMEELLNRVQHQLELPIPVEKVCRGSLLSHTQFQIAYTEWGYKDISDVFYKELAAQSAE